MSERFRLKKMTLYRRLFCEVLYRNIEDYKRLGYDTKTLQRIYEVKCR